MEGKLNKKKPYAVVYGHSEALYEQDGMLFDGGENFIRHVQENVKEKKEEKKTGKTTPDTVDNVEEFLLQVLSGGPILQNVVKKESEKKNIIWSEVLSVSAQMKVRKNTRSGEIFWTLPAA